MWGAHVQDLGLRTQEPGDARFVGDGQPLVAGQAVLEGGARWSRLGGVEPVTQPLEGVDAEIFLELTCQLGPDETGGRHVVGGALQGRRVVAEIAGERPEAGVEPVVWQSKTTTSSSAVVTARRTARRACRDRRWCSR